MQSESSEAVLLLNAVAEAFTDKPIPVGPAVQSDSSQAVILSADVQARDQSVAVQRFVVAYHSSTSISKIISGAQLQVSDRRYKVSRIDSTQGGTAGFFVFASAGKLFTADSDSRRIRIAVDPKSTADNEQLQLSIGSRASKRMRAVAVANGSQLNADNILGTVTASRRTFKRAGVHLDLAAAESERSAEGVSIMMELDMSAFAVDVAIPWSPRLLSDVGKRRQSGGVFFAVTDSSGRPITASVQSATLEVVQVVANEQLLTANQLKLSEGQEQRFTVAVQVDPESEKDSACLRAADIGYLSSSSGQLHITSDSLNMKCADF
jgi:hypothetical protein